MRRLSVRLGLVLSCLLMLVTIGAFPFALDSIVHSVRSEGNSEGYQVWSPTETSGESTRLSISAQSIDEANKDIVLDVSGYHACPAGCDQAQRLEFYSVDGDPRGSVGDPPAVVMDLPVDSADVDQEITLPITGDLSVYPFDSYRLDLGVALSDVSPSGATTPLGAPQARSQLAMSVDDRVSRTELATPTVLGSGDYETHEAAYDTVVRLSFSRPAYLLIVTVLLILLVIFAEIYAVFGRPFDQIIPTIGGLVLGMWGVRSLLVGSYPPDSTGVDLVLESAILFLLLAFALRATVFMWGRHREHLRASED